MLKISTGTLLNLRVTGTLNARKVGKIYFYKADEIEKLLNEPEKKARKRKSKSGGAAVVQGAILFKGVKKQE
jgi:hypothetical protein